MRLKRTGMVSVLIMALVLSAMPIAHAGPPPAVQTLKPTKMTSMGPSDSNAAATLNGTINPNGGSCTVHFEYGPTTAYGSTVSASPASVSGSSPITVSADIAGLSAGALYHCRLVAVSDSDAYYRQEFADAIVQEARAQFESLIPKIPYIGGSRNLMTSDLVESVKLLAFYRAMQERGVAPGETFPIVYQAMKARLARYPGFLRKLIGRLQLSAFFKNRLRRLSVEARKWAIPENFVFEVVDGDGAEFDWGIEFRECAIYKFYRAQGAEALMPYICPNDYITSEAFGLGLMRRGTLPEGATVCDQHLKKGRKTELRLPDSVARS